MKLNMEAFQQKVQPIANNLSENRYLKAIMGGMMAALPAVIIGSLAAILKQLPIEAYQNFIISNGIDHFLQLPVTFTTNFLAVIFLISISNSLAETFDVKGIIPAIMALISFFIITPVEPIIDDIGMASAIIPMQWLGATGIFTAIIVSIVSTRLFVFITQKGWTIKMPESVPPFIKNSFASLIPGTIIVALFVIITAIFANTSFGSVHAFIYGLLQTPLQQLGGNIWAILIVALIGQLLWFFGIHGTMVTFSVVMPVWMALDAQQLSAYSAGQELPNIVGLNFFAVYTFGGSALGLCILMIIARSKRYKTLGRLSIVPAAFGITEPVIFGTPLVFNPLFAIPFIFNNCISLTLAYLATVVGIIPPLTGVTAPAGMPIILQGLMAGSWQTALFQVALIVIWVGLWYPFFRIAEKQAIQQENVKSEDDNKASVRTVN
ncbi:PTS sugar transporter subunit IIC [Metabacillus arenae]|uniref:Permease IIC component n=1 Tax=Metabacillus arenae TaxID=2771434 RepID=A0A926NJB3_9BACI|nr:PTS transporter subunit EIIC [Metabacillus arenae]MBD1382391.1 PTS sugar transporter subunit IIC [Metabacillus arenae]